MMMTFAASREAVEKALAVVTVVGFFVGLVLGLLV